MSRDADRYRLTPMAKQDLKDQTAWTRREYGEARSVANLRGLTAAFERLAIMPLSAPIRSEQEFAAAGVRSLTFQNRLLVFYRPEPGGGVEILRVVDGRRDLPRVLLFGSNRGDSSEL